MLPEALPLVSAAPTLPSAVAWASSPPPPPAHRQVLANFTQEYTGSTDDDESIKGDCVIVPRGAAAILIRESAQQRRLQFLTLTANPIDAQIITAKYRAALLRQVAESLELPVDEVVPTDEALDAQAQAAQEAQAQAVAEAQQAEVGKLQLEHKLDMEKEAAISAREKEAAGATMISDVVKQAVQNAMQSSAESMKKNTKKLKYQYNDAGEIVGGEVE